MIDLKVPSQRNSCFLFRDRLSGLFRETSSTCPSGKITTPYHKEWLHCYSVIAGSDESETEKLYARCKDPGRKLFAYTCAFLQLVKLIRIQDRNVNSTQPRKRKNKRQRWGRKLWGIFQRQLRQDTQREADWIYGIKRFMWSKMLVFPSFRFWSQAIIKSHHLDGWNCTGAHFVTI